jgi:hypothetical protein
MFHQQLQIFKSALGTSNTSHHSNTVFKQLELREAFGQQSRPSGAQFTTAGTESDLVSRSGLWAVVQPTASGSADRLHRGHSN